MVGYQTFDHWDKVAVRFVDFCQSDQILGNHYEILRQFSSHGYRTKARTLCCFGLIFFLIRTFKKLADYGPQQPQNTSLKCYFLIFDYE